MNAVADPARHRFYSDLAPWWPLLSPPAHYAEEAAFTLTLLESGRIPVREVLELGSGGGSNAVHWTGRFDMTLVDLSPQMLAVSMALNPGFEHLEGDMRTVRLGRLFDAVLIHDAIEYMTTRDDLSAAIRTAFVHLRPGGAAVFVPDYTRETFAPSSSHGGSDGPDGRAARYLDWSWDPDERDSWTQVDYAFLLREADGTVSAVHETHRCGLFGRGEWLAATAEQGFDARRVEEITSDDRDPRDFFVGYRLPD